MSGFPNLQNQPAGAIPVYTEALGSNGLLIQNIIANQYAAATINNATGTGSQTLITGAPGYYFTSYGFQCDANATIASAGTVTVNFTDSAYGIVAQFRIWIPASFASPTVPTVIRQVEAPQSYWNNKTANSSLSVAINTTLATGSIRTFVRYGLCSFVG